MPAFRRHGNVTVFVEGWGLYTERLADEMGLYSGDVERMGILSFDSWRAGRLVVDTGLHALGWSRQKAIDYFVENSPQAINNIVNEVDRYIGYTGQALAYKMGQREQSSDSAARHRRRWDRASTSRDSMTPCSSPVLSRSDSSATSLTSGRRAKRMISDIRRDLISPSDTSPIPREDLVALANDDGDGASTVQTAEHHLHLSARAPCDAPGRSTVPSTRSTRRRSATRGLPNECPPRRQVTRGGHRPRARHPECPDR